MSFDVMSFLDDPTYSTGCVRNVKKCLLRVTSPRISEHFSRDSLWVVASYAEQFLEQVIGSIFSRDL